MRRRKSTGNILSFGQKLDGKMHRNLDILRKEPARAKRCHAGKEKKRKAQKWKNTQKGIFFV